MMGCVYFANVVRKEDYSTFGGNVKPVTQSQTMTGYNFRTSKADELGTTMSMDHRSHHQRIHSFAGNGIYESGRH
eukprot:2413112-Heterocapsa_arctica.AAC.1